MRIALLGVGSIGSYVLSRIRKGLIARATLVGIAASPRSEARLAHLARTASCPYTTNPIELIGYKPDLVVESASSQAVEQYAVKFLEEGIDLLVMSVGAFSDRSLFERAQKAASRGGATVHVPTGAIGGLDVLRAASIEGLSEVTLKTSKPPAGLKGAPYFDDHPVDLDALGQKTTIFEGSARKAIPLFPANVNVAAAVSIAGLGFDRTVVTIVADPTLDRNVHEIVARGSFGEFSLQLRNHASEANPKTSLLACLSPLATLKRRSEWLQIA